MKENQKVSGGSEGSTGRLMPIKSESGSALLIENQSATPLPHSNGEGFQSMNLIDDSVNHLFGLMKDVSASQEYEDGTKYVDTKSVKAAVECAKEIRSLIKLKLDVSKEFRK